MRTRWIMAWVLVGVAGCDGPRMSDAGPTPMDGGVCAGASDGTACGAGRICVASACSMSTCGDRVTDPRNDEECDDGNDAMFDGCEPASSPTPCRFTCNDVGGCTDHEPCNGEETCNTSTHVCESGAVPDNGDA